MLALNPQYIVDDTQTKQAVVIQINEWQKILEKLKMLDNIEAYNKAKIVKARLYRLNER